jgi:hypothetical protein
MLLRIVELPLILPQCDTIYGSGRRRIDKLRKPSFYVTGALHVLVRVSEPTA